jgi:hypothetical protein
LPADCAVRAAELGKFLFPDADVAVFLPASSSLWVNHCIHEHGPCKQAHTNKQINTS